MEADRRMDESRRSQIRRESDCLECGEHKAWEERLKILNVIPKLAFRTTLNMGILSLITLLFTLLLLVVQTSRSEMDQKQDRHEANIKSEQTEMRDQVRDIVRNVNNIDRNVAVILKALEMDKVQAEKERNETRAAIEELRRYRDKGK